MDNKKEVQRPLCLKLDDAKMEIFNAISNASKNHQIPFYLLESIMKDAYQQVVTLAKNERETAQHSYEQELLNAKEK